jgi:hypothetical protein
MRMRLSETAARMIRETAARQFGAGAQVWLFGSLVWDKARGGDTDPLVAPKLSWKARRGPPRSVHPRCTGSRAISGSTS